MTPRKKRRKDRVRGLIKSVKVRKGRSFHVLVGEFAREAEFFALESRRRRKAAKGVG